jgi:hypothetical protein
VTYAHQNTAGIKAGDKYEVGTPINLQQINQPHLHVQTSQLSGSELENQIQQNLNLPYKPGVTPTVSPSQQQTQKITTEQRKTEALKSMNALNWLNNNITNEKPLIFNDEANSATNNYQSNQSFQDINKDGKVNAQDAPVVASRVLEVTPNLRDLYNDKGAQFVNVKFVEEIPVTSNSKSSISEGYKHINAQVVAPQSTQADTVDIYVALRNEYGSLINQFDIAYEVAHEDAHVQQLSNWSERKLTKDQNIAYENRPSEIEAQANAERNAQFWEAQYINNFKEVLDEYRQNNQE